MRTKGEKQQYMTSVKEVMAFRDSPRGQFIIAQALVVAVEELSKVKGPMREYSNIEDMNLLIGVLYPGLAEAIRQTYIESRTRLSSMVEPRLAQQGDNNGTDQ